MRKSKSNREYYDKSMKWKEKIENNKWLRETARDELISEKINPAERTKLYMKFIFPSGKY
mgnify:CR=1 FL=1